MKNVKISLIAAIGENRELGLNNKLLWQIPEDLKHFKDITANHAVIMGRKTFESIGRPLPNRLNIIVTRDKTLLETNHGFWTQLRQGYAGRASQNDNVVIANSLEQAIEEAKTKLPDKNEIFIIGGGQIYKQGIRLADKLYLTIVEGHYEADTYFPDYSEFKKVISQKKGESHGYKYTFLELTR